ncbi:hypothetical protein M433DRAFT_586 [Acidomyces richmondensis BFW]|nr:hypothetical protein M433DRAFT_586 [Acidomyces richmondensis BFW]
MADLSRDTELELERFRSEWREEVSARNKKPVPEISVNRLERKEHWHKYPPQSVPGPSASLQQDGANSSEDVEPRTYHDLPDNEEQGKLNDGQNHEQNRVKEPRSALEHYERAVEKETQGQLGDSMKHYRKAFKLDEGVHEAYKRKHFPPSAFVQSRPSNPNPSNAAATVPETGHHSMHGSATALPSTLKQLVEEFSGMRIEAPPPPTDASPKERSLLGELPEEILSQILIHLAVADVASFTRVSQVCKRLAYLVLTEEAIWKRVVVGKEFGFGAMIYDFVCELDGSPLKANQEVSRFPDTDAQVHIDLPLPPTRDEQDLAFSALTEQLLHTTYSSSYRQMFRNRPRVRFNGCYISTVNYNRPGAQSTNTLSWGNPVHVVTYFRYLRFFRDGTVISLLTTSEPAEVVHYLTKENVHDHHGNVLPNSVMKDALCGRWRLTGPLASTLNPATGQQEEEGEVRVETEGVTEKYTYHMHLALLHAGKGNRNNKLAWKNFWSYNRLTDDWAEFWLKNDRAFYWSRVKSYGMGD